MDEIDNTFVNGRIWTTEHNYPTVNQQRRQIAFDGENAMINSLDIKSSVVAIDRQSKDNNSFSSDGVQQRHLDHDYKIKKNTINPDNYEQSQIHEGNASASTILTQYIQNEPKKPINNNLIGVQSRFRRKHYHTTLLILIWLLVCFLIILIVLIILSVIFYRNNYEICKTKQCLRTAANLIYTMDESSDPCNDFYRFTCGKWMEEHPRPETMTSNDWFREKQASVIRQLRAFLQQNITANEPEAVTKVKLMYQACMDTEHMDNLQMEPLLHFLEAFQLPFIPEGFNVTLSDKLKPSFSQRSSDFNWIASLVRIKQYLGMDLIIGFDIFTDPINRTIKRIAFGTPETDSALPFNNNDLNTLLNRIKKNTIFGSNLRSRKTQKDFHTFNVNTNPDMNVDEYENIEKSAEDDDLDLESDKETDSMENGSMAAYFAYIKRLIVLYATYLGSSDIDINHLEEFTVEMATEAVTIARKIHQFKDDAENTTKPSKNGIDDIVYVSLDELQNHTDQLIAPNTLPIWSEYLNLMMANSSTWHLINHTQIQILTSPADLLYLQNIVEYLYEVPIEHLELYIWLSTVEELILHTTSEMRALHAEYMHSVIGTEGNIPRSLYCTQGVNSLMGMAVSYALTNDSNDAQEKLSRARHMLNDIRRSFNKLVWQTSWMDEQTKLETLKKSAAMQSFIGYPEWLTNKTILDESYRGFTVKSDTHLMNMINILHWEMKYKLDNLNVPEIFDWATAPSVVNAFHTFQANAITIPIAILQYPFYDLGLEALNYGSIGSILGHELTHGFDDNGRMFDRHGNMIQWWSNNTINEYINRTECFVKQYNSYYLPAIGHHIDGELTLGENIADNGGMREAFHAYRLYVEENGQESKRLPGLEHYNHEQLFFIAFGNLWCESYTLTAYQYALKDSHCPGQIRLKGVLSNSEEFAQTFDCPLGSAMNPKRNKCRIW